MEYVCIAAHGDHETGNVVEVPAGAAVSPVHFAPRGSPEAAAAEAGRGAVTPYTPPAVPSPAETAESPGAVQDAPPAGDPAEPPPLSTPVLAAPAAEGSNL